MPNENIPLNLINRILEDNNCYFNLLSFGVICFIAIDNRNNIFPKFKFKIILQIIMPHYYFYIVVFVSIL